VRLLMPGQDSEESKQQEGPVVWIETRSMRYQLGSPAECYAGVYEALDMQVNTCQVCLNYMYWNPSAEPEFATKEICTNDRYNDQSDQHSNRRKFDEKYLGEQNGFLVWILDSQWQTTDSATSKCALMLQMRDKAGSMNCMSKASRRRCRDDSSDDDIAARQCLYCGSKDDEEDMLLCDGCDKGFHSMCVNITPEEMAALVKGNAEWRCVACNHEVLRQPIDCCLQSHFLKATVLEGLRPDVDWERMPKNCMAGLDDNQYGELTLHGTCQVLCLLRHHLGVQLGCGSLFVDLGSGLGQIALRVALLTGADVCGIELSEYCTEYAQIWRDDLRMKPLFNDYHCAPDSGSKIEFLAEDFLQEHLRDKYERATCMFINNFVFTHQTNAALSERILEWCKVDTIVVVAKDMPKPLKYVPNDMEFLGVFQLPCGSASWTDNDVLSMSVYKVVQGHTDIKRRRTDRPNSWTCRWDRCNDVQCAVELLSSTDKSNNS